MQKTSLHKDWIDPHAHGIVKALQKAGFTSYLVGGCVRDLLAGIHPKDFDIATSAIPSQVRRVIPQARIIGKRFRLVLVFRGDKQYEIATFRRDARPDELDINGEPLQSDNLFGDPEQDAKRRDFTINSMFYDPVGEHVIDHCEGMSDIENCTLRMIGDPATRIKEDPIRTLRALRLSHKLNFSIELTFRQAIKENAVELKRAVLPRRREELLKILRLKNPFACLQEAYDLDILSSIFPTLHKLFENAEQVELFRTHLHASLQLVKNNGLPIDLYNSFVFSYLKSVTLDSDQYIEMAQYFNQPTFLSFLKEELGLFNAEINTLMRSFESVHELCDVEKWRTRGARRLQSQMKAEYFLYTMRMISWDYLLNAEQMWFWDSTYTDFLHQRASKG